MLIKRPIQAGKGASIPLRQSQLTRFNEENHHIKKEGSSWCTEKSVQSLKIIHLHEDRVFPWNHRTTQLSTSNNAGLFMIMMLKQQVNVGNWKLHVKKQQNNNVGLRNVVLVNAELLQINLRMNLSVGFSPKSIWEFMLLGSLERWYSITGETADQ